MTDASTPSASPISSDAAELDYEAAQAELAQLVARLEGGQVSLTESLQLWQRGEELVAMCEEFLAGARQQLSRAQAATEAAERNEAP